MAKLPHAVTHTAYDIEYISTRAIRYFIHLGRSTFTEPSGVCCLALPFPFAGSAKPKLYLPNFLPSIVQDRANVSSVCAVRMSSQSLAREVEYDIDVMGGNLRDARGMDKLVAFLAREPRS